MNLNLLKRILSLLLVLTMLVGNLPAAAFAAEDIGEPDFVEETVAPTETEAATEETVEETFPEPTEKVTEPEEEEPTDIPEDPDAEKEIPEDDGDPAGEEGEYTEDIQELYATHSHPVCGSRCNCASSSHSNLTWTAWDGTTKMYNGNYYLTKDIVLSSTMILDYSYVSYLCLNGHTITCESMVFDIYSYRTLVITDCVGTGKVISTNGNYVIGNNKSLTIYGGTIVNTRESGWNSAILACSNTNTYIYGGRMEGQDMAIYGDVNSKIYVRGGTVAGTGGGYAIYGDGNLTISAGSICTDGSTSIALSSGNFTMSGGSVDGNVYLYDGSDNPGTTSISGGTITGGLDCYYNTITITGGDIESAVLSGDTEIRAGTFRGYCTLAGANTNVYGGNFSDCSYLNIYGSTWICGGSFSTVAVGSEDSLYLSGVPEIGELQIASPGTVSAQSPDGSGSFGGDPIPIQMGYSTASASPWGDGKTLIKNVTSNAVAQKFTLTGFKSEWLYLERSGTNLVLRLLPYGRLNFGEWGIRDGVLTLSGSGSIDSFSSGREQPWYPYANQITAIVVADGILGIPAYAFEYLENVETIRLPNTLTTLNLNAFQDCGSLNNLVLPASLKTISGTSNTGYPAFIRCESLTDVYYMGTEEEWETLKNGQRITSADSDMTLHCLELVECGATCTQPGPQAHYRFDDQAFGLYDMDKKAITQPGTVPALGHRITQDHTEVVDPLTIESTTSVPFLKEGNTYYSQNHSAYSTCQLKIVAQYACTLTIQYGVSSEPNYDKMFITHNTVDLVNISGVVSNQQRTLDLAAGDKVYILYSKDGTVDKNDDQCWATLIYDHVQLDISEDIPAENFEPDCENAVVCDYCDTVVKAALGHAMSQWTVTTPATCTADGLRNRTCGRCGEGEEEIIPAGHSYDENHQCTVCGAYEQPGGSCGEDLDWTLEQNGQLVISGTGEMSGYGSGEAPWFEDRDMITSVVIGEGVTDIGDDAFRDCENLTTVVLPDGLKTIGDNAFSGCTGLTDINIPDTVTEIGEGAFRDCDSLTCIILPAGITGIGSDAFADCDSLTDIYYGGTAEQWEALGTEVPDHTYVHYSCTDPENHWQTGTQEATCTEDGYTYEGCPCGHQRNVVITETKLGHDMGTWTVVLNATCTEPGLQRKDCSRCDHYETEEIPLNGHSHEAVVTPPTCTEDGFTTHTCHCGDTYTDTPVGALGHVPVTDDAVAPTCTETGLTKGVHCDRDGEILIAQEIIPANGHSFVMEDDRIFCTACGEELSVRIPQEYAVLHVGQTLELDVSPAEYADQVEWTVENDDGTVTTAANVLTAAKAGTAYVKATVSAGEFRSDVRFRVDVTEVPVEGVQLSTAKATTELYSTDYTDLEVLLKLSQNYTLSEQAGVQDDGIAIDSARFTDDILAVLFRISVLDDRRIQIVPTDYAVESAQANAKSVAGKYTGTITVTVQGQEYETNKLTLTVKQTKPKVKATVPAFNSFYAGQAQSIVITGGTPTAIYENDAKNTAKTTAIPTWLNLEDGVLTLNENAPKKSVSGKAYLLVETEQWRIPTAVTLSVKNSYKVPGVKLSASSVTVSNLQTAASVDLQLLCTSKTDILKNLNITAITAPEGYSIENFNAETGTFTLKAPNGFKSGKLTLGVTYGNVTKNLTLTVKAQDVKLKLSKTKLTLNKLTDDKGTVTVTCTAKDYVLTKPVITLEDSAKGKLDVTYANGELTVATNAATQYGKTYKIFLKAHADAPASTLSVTVATVAKSEVSVTLKTTGKIDVIRDGSAVTVTPTYKNCTTPGAKENLVILNSKNVPVNDLFRIEPNGNGAYTVTKAEGAALTAGTYKIMMEAKVGEQEFASKAVKLSVTMASPKLTVKTSGTTLFAKDKNDRALVWFEAKDAALNGVEHVTIKDTKYQDKFEILDYENGQFAIVFSNGVPETLIGKTVTLNLNVFLEGNPTAKANTTAKVKLTILK